MKRSNKIYRLVLVLFLMFGISVPAFAQAGEAWLVDGFGHFFISVIAGVLLAFAFQFLLTNLAVAAGITAIGDVREMNFQRSGGKPQGGDQNDSTPMGVKISSGFGLYLTATMAISLFFASLIAVKLTLTPNNTIGFAVGLVIWAGFLLLSLYIDSKMISSLTGSIFSSVKSILGAGTSAAENIFGSSERSRARDTAKDTIKAIREEITEGFDLSGIESKLDEYINKMEPQKFSPDSMKHQLAELIQDVEIREEYSPDDPDTVRHLFLEVASEQPNITDEDKEKLKTVFDQAREISTQEGSRADKAISAATKLAPGGEEQGKEYWEKVKQHLKDTHEEELQPDKLKNDLNEILNNPKATPEVVRARASKIDRTALKSVLSNMEGMTEQKAEQYLSKADEYLETIKSRTDEAKSQASETQNVTKEKSNEMKARAEKRIRDWFNRMDQPELQYDRVKQDVKHIFDDPKTAPSVLKSRLQKMDRESMIALVSNNSKISREQAERVVEKMEQGRDEVLRKAEEIEQKVKEKTEKAKQEALRQAENTRKTAAAAAWWVFIATVVSGGASALGGILALTI